MNADPTNDDPYSNDPYSDDWVELLGLPISTLDTAAAVRAIVERPPTRAFDYVVTPNAHHMVMLARGNEAFRAAYCAAWLTLSDGRVVPKLARMLFDIDLPHASGSDVTRILLENHIRAHDPVTVIGGGPMLEAALVARFGLTHLAIHDPPFGFIRDAAAVEACLDFLAAHPARYVFLAVGAPQSEILAHLARQRGNLTGVGLCIGGSLLMATGMVSRSPEWLRAMGLEGLYRLIQRPRSHFRRVFIESLPIVWLMLRARFFDGPGILPRGYGR